MKYLIFFASLILFISARAQKAEKIVGRARQQKSIAYYKEQALAWKKETESRPTDPEVWYNYYYVNRNLLYSDTTDTRTDEEKQAFFDQLLRDMEKNVPNSYEFNLCKWMAGGFDMSLLPYLKKAAALGTNRTEHIDFMINIGETMRNTADRNLYSIKKFEAGLFSTGILYYNYNVLAGLPPNAILISSGDNDTYPIWYLQATGIRKDVTVINLHLLHLDDYRKKLFTEMGITDLDKTGDGKNSTLVQNPDYQKNLIRHIASNKKNYPVLVALTTACNNQYTSTVEQDLYLTGLAYQYSTKAIDNMALLKRNVEQYFALDYIDKPFYNDISPDLVKHINTNYLVPLLKLYDHYKLAGEGQKMLWIKQKVLAISSGTEHEQSVTARLQ